jgi:hypothetical protein
MTNSEFNPGFLGMALSPRFFLGALAPDRKDKAGASVAPA